MFDRIGIKRSRKEFNWACIETLERFKMQDSKVICLNVRTKMKKKEGKRVEE